MEGFLYEVFDQDAENLALFWSPVKIANLKSILHNFEKEIMNYDADETFLEQFEDWIDNENKIPLERVFTQKVRL